MDFITSDTHFLHANSLNFEGCALRKSLYKTEEEMNEGIIRQWNKQRYGSCQAFGHCHGGFAGVGRQMDVGWDNWARLLTVNEVFDLLMAIPVHITEHW